MNMPVLESSVYQLRLESLSWEHFSDLAIACAEENLGEILYNSVPYLHNLKNIFLRPLNSKLKVNGWLLLSSI